MNNFLTSTRVVVQVDRWFLTRYNYAWIFINSTRQQVSLWHNGKSDELISNCFGRRRKAKARAQTNCSLTEPKWINSMSIIIITASYIYFFFVHIHFDKNFQWIRKKKEIFGMCESSTLRSNFNWTLKISLEYYANSIENKPLSESIH